MISIMPFSGDEARKGVILFGFSLDGLSANTQISLLAVVFFTFMVVHDAIQERIVSTDGWQFPALMTLIEFGACAVGPTLTREFSFSAPRSASLWQYGCVTLFVLGSASCVNAAITMVSYPLKVVFKSCKLLPTMAIGILLLGKQYHTPDFVAASMLCLGLVGFTLAERQAAMAMDIDMVDASLSSKLPLGIGLLCVAVLLDGTAPNVQERIMTKAPAAEAMAWTNLLGGTVSFAVMLATGEIARALAWFSSPAILIPMGGQLLMLGLSTYLSVSCYMVLVKHYGGAMTVLLATVRKIVTITISFVIFKKPFNWIYGMAGCSVLAGMAIKPIFQQIQKRRDCAATHAELQADWEAVEGCQSGRKPLSQLPVP